jgi:hypothetical protein
VLRQFRATVAYGELAGAGSILEDDEQGNNSADDDDEGLQLTPPATLTDPKPDTQEDPVSGETKRATSTVQVTYSPTEWALLQAKFPMSGEDWDAMIEVLQAMKRGLVG